MTEWTTGAGFIACPFDPSHLLPAEHLLAHVLKIHCNDSLGVCLTAFTRLKADPLGNKRVRPAGELERSQPPTQPFSSPPGVVPQQAAGPIPARPTRLHIAYYLGVLPESVLRTYLSRFGPIDNVYHNQPKHLYFVEMVSGDDATAAVEATPHGVRRTFEGHTFVVNRATPKFGEASPALAPGQQQQQPMHQGQQQAQTHQYQQHAVPVASSIAPPLQQHPQTFAANGITPAHAAPYGFQPPPAAAVAVQSRPLAAASSAPPRNDRPAAPPADSEPRCQSSVLLAQIPKNRPASAFVLLHNVPLNATERDVFGTIRAAKDGAQPLLITLVAAPEEGQLRSASVEFPSVDAARAVVEGFNGNNVTLGGNRVVAQFV